ncbi:MAG: zinc ABC transporter substrate-binding protein [bacterium]
MNRQRNRKPRPTIPRLLALGALAAWLVAQPLPALAAQPLPARRAEPPAVVATIRPLHSLVAAVMQGVGEPVLLIKGAGSPHHYSLRPSQARALAAARLVFWVGPELETFLARAARSFSETARWVALSRSPGTILRNDPHLWLDPRNALAMARAIRAALAAADPVNGPRYAGNLRRLAAQITALDRKLLADLSPLGGRPYLAYHDAYTHFEERYGLRGLGALTGSTGQRAGARRVARLRAALRGALGHGGACLFVQPGTPRRLTNNLLEGTGARLATLDPLGVNIEPGPALYAELMEKMGEAVAGCLGG